MAVSGIEHGVEVLDRRRIVVTDVKIPGAKQPYHYAADLEPSDAPSYLMECAAISERLAKTAITEAVGELDRNRYRVVGAALLLASGRPLPSLVEILASHALIHAAEGEFFRDAARKACASLRIPVTAIRERELPQAAVTAFGRAASRIQSTIAGLGHSLGPPWTQDHKTAALAARVILATAKSSAFEAA